MIFNEISLGDFVAFVAYLDLLVWPMMALGWVVNLFQRSSASMVRIERLLSEKNEIKSKMLSDINKDNISVKGRITISASESYYMGRLYV